MNFKDILAVGAQFMGGDTSKIGLVKQAYDMAQKYKSDPNGIQKAISELGITKEQADDAMRRLQEDGKIKSAVESLNPQLPLYLRNISSKVNFAGGQIGNRGAPPDTTATSNISDLESRLRKL